MRYGMDERGSALVFILLTMVGLVLSGLALLSLARQERLMAQYQYRQTQAFYLAEAGLQWAEARLVQSPAYRGTIVLTWEEGGQTEVNISEEGGLISVTSRAEGDGLQCTLVAAFQVLDHTLLYGTDGNLFTRELVLAAHPDDGDGAPLPRVEGKVVTPGGEDGGGSSDFFFPELPLSVYPRALQCRHLTPAQLAGNRNLNGIIYVAGDVMLEREEDSIGGRAVLLVEGQFTVRGNAALEGDFVLLAGEGIDLSGTTKVQGLLYTPGFFRFGGTGDITGVVWVGGESYLEGEVWIREYGGDKGFLLGELPPVLVVRKLWYRK
jgi:hypothetical protein